MTQGPGGVAIQFLHVFGLIILIGPFSDEWRVCVMTRRGNQRPNERSAYCGGTCTATAMQGSSHYIMFISRLLLNIQIYNN